MYVYKYNINKTIMSEQPDGSTDIDPNLLTGKLNENNVRGGVDHLIQIARNYMEVKGKLEISTFERFLNADSLQFDVSTFDEGTTLKDAVLERFKNWSTTFFLHQKVYQHPNYNTIRKMVEHVQNEASKIAPK